jgi:CRISPR-associated protein Csx17
MTVHLHQLSGCAPVPLAHYLKAIGILRVVAQQKDPNVRGFWQDQGFVLLTTLDAAQLEAFFLHEYAPTPFVSPWNRGSGFYTRDDKGLTPVERSIAPRFASFRDGIGAARLQLDAIAAADAEVRRLKDTTKNQKGQKATRSKDDPEYKRELAAAEREFKRLKADLFAPFALAWRGPHRDWMDAAMVLSADNEPSYPALLGTGGNDGKLDFTNNAMQRLGDLFDLGSETGAPSSIAASLLKTALFESTSIGLLVGAVGQFLPGSAGGANATTGPDSKIGLVNPWDFVLMLEGAVAFRGQATRRLGARDDARAAIPFAVTSQAVGHATRGKEKDARGEQWMPLWDRPASWADVSALFGEGRAQLGRASVRRPLDFARAIARLGVARGLTGFVRYGYLERNGQSNLAVPLGRIAVAAHPRARLMDEISAWRDRLHREATDAPARLGVVVSRLSDAVFDVLTRDAEPARWQSLLIAIDEVERVQASGTAFQIGPCPVLSPAWLDAAADDSPEWRLALALGSAAGDYRAGRPTDPVRAHMLPIDPKKPWSYAVSSEKRLMLDPRVVMHGRDPLADLVALVERRLVEASQRGSRRLALVSLPGAGARLDDLERFLSGSVNLDRTVSLGRALSALDWGRTSLPSVRVRPRALRPDEAWDAVRLCSVPFAVRERTIPMEPAMVRRLAAGDAVGAVEIALRRLRAAGFRPPLVAAVADAATARRWAAALAFPISPAVAAAMAQRFENPSRESA